MSYREKFLQQRWILTLILAAVALPGFAQSDNAAQQANGVGDQQGDQNQNAPAPAFGQEPAIPSASENPPISGLDQPSLEPGVVSRSFLEPGAIVSESGDSNIPGDLGSGTQGAGATTRVMGTMIMQKIWTRYETDLQYLGGGVFYEGVTHSSNQIQNADIAQRVTWRTGQLGLRDSVTYLPDGTFGAESYGGSGALEAGMAGLGTQLGALSQGTESGITGNLSAGQFGSLGEQPRLTNSAVADLVETVSPRSSFTAAGSYGFVHFTDTDNATHLVDSDQVAAQAAYDHQLNRSDQMALAYGFENFHFAQFPGSSVVVNSVLLAYGHRISGRMDMVVAAGPQIAQLHSPSFGSSNRISAEGNLRLRYRFTRSTVQLEYRHYNTNGSGYFLGATSDVGSLSLLRSLGRVWDFNGDAGYARNQRLEPVAAVIPATTDQFFFAGAAAHRHIGRHFRLFFSYQYNRFSFNSTVCESAGDCGKVSDRQLGAIGLEWFPHPVRLD